MRRPASSTIILSYFSTVERRWAIVIIVLSLNLSEIIFWITSSFLKSIFAVASSIKTIFERERSALQMHINCFSPADRQLLETLALSPPFLSTTAQILHCFSTRISSYSLYYPKRLRLSRNEEFIKMGYWSITVISLLKLFNSNFPMEVLSIRMSP